MTVTEAAKSVHRKAMDLLCSRRIVFHHVPKCGGTSVGRALRRSYILSQGTVTPFESERAFEAAQDFRKRGAIGDVSDFREMMLLYMLYCDVRCVAAHIPFSEVAFEEFSGRYAFVTLLRDPVKRFISNYYWSHGRPAGVQHIAEPLEEFVLTKRARRLGSTYARYFSGAPAAEEFTGRHADAAIQNLQRMHFVGFLDDMARFNKGMRTVTSRRVKFGMENVGDVSARRNTVIPDDVLDQVTDACRVDLEIWRAVQNLRCRSPIGIQLAP
jgi:hypothetical protein